MIWELKTMTERVLVTGGTGYVAGWCIAELLEVPLAGGEDHIERVEGRGRNRELGAIRGAEPVENKRQVATPQLGR